LFVIIKHDHGHCVPATQAAINSIGRKYIVLEPKNTWQSPHGSIAS
jgi:hypothetical protein